MRLPSITLLVFLVPIAVGLLGTVLPALGYLPAIGARTLSFQPFADAMSQPGFWTSVRVSLFVGVAAGTLSVLLAGALIVVAGATWGLRALEICALPLLAVPHATLAIGLAFLIAPTGFIVRLLTPWATGTLRPPTDLITVNDPWGLSLVLGLVAKETPFLIMMMLAALPVVAWQRQIQVAQGMGYSLAHAFIKGVWPQIWGPLRLPVYAVVAYGLANVDQAQVLGPGQPGSLAILTVRWFSDFDLSLYPRAAASSLLQLLLVLMVLCAAYGLERLAWRWAQGWICQGERGGLLDQAVWATGALGALVLGAGLASLALLVVWSVAGSWPFPSVWPRELDADTWRLAPKRLGEPLWTTLAVAASSTAVALVLAVLSLESLSRSGRTRDLPMALIYVPLILPQVAFLFGLQVALVAMRLEGTHAAVVLVHIVFVLPYVLLSLARTWGALDPRYARAAAGLGAGPWRTLFSVKIPMLAEALMLAAATGIAISVGQYLPTLIAGAGRVTSLTTEALTLAGGADRRVLGALGVLLAAIPLLAFGMARLAAALLKRNRRGLT